MACSNSKQRRQRRKRADAPKNAEGPEKPAVVESLRYPLLSTVEYAELTLKFYKQKRGPEHTDYKIVRVLGSCRVLAIVPELKELGVFDWCHVSFIASRKSDATKEVLFFGELVDFGYGNQLVLNNFSILKLDDPSIIYGCGFCPPDKDHPHPRGAYYAGEWDYEPTNDTSQKEMAITFEQHLISNQKNQFSGPTFNLKHGLLFKPEPFVVVVLDPSLRSPLFSTLEYAKLALELYKEERIIVAVDYEIVQALGSSRVLSQVFKAEVVDWCHVSFTAKPRNSDCNDDIVLFFAELVDFSYGDQLSLNFFSISKPDAPGITYGCGFCPPGEDHPHLPYAYFAGRCDGKTTNEYTSQEELAICFQRQVISKRKDKNRNKYARQTMWPELVEPDPSRFSPMLSDHEYARLALSYISKAEEVEYELVRTMYYNRRRCVVGMSGYGQWCHVYFIAKPKTMSDDNSLVHFFAELNDPGIRKFNLSTYSKMDPDGVEIDEGCGICPVSEKYPHPVTGLYIAGFGPHIGCLRENYLHCNRCNRSDSDDDF